MATLEAGFICPNISVTLGERKLSPETIQVISITGKILALPICETRPISVNCRVARCDIKELATEAPTGRVVTKPSLNPSYPILVQSAEVRALRNATVVTNNIINLEGLCRQ